MASDGEVQGLELALPQWGGLESAQKWTDQIAKFTGVN